MDSMMLDVITMSIARRRLWERSLGRGLCECPSEHEPPIATGWQYRVRAEACL